MKRILAVATREFLATVATKAFILGMFIPLVLTGVAIVLTPLLLNKAAPKVSGHVALIDQTGVLGTKLKDEFAPEKMADRAADQMVKAIESSGAPGVDENIAKMATQQMAAQRQLPTLTLRELPADTETESAKAEILGDQSGGREKGSDPRLALAVVPASTLTADDAGVFGDFQLFTAPKLDVEVQRDIQRTIGDAIVEARIEKSGLDPVKVRALTGRPRGDVKSVTESGDQKINEVAKLLIPGAFMLLLWISTFTCGQYLLTSTIEEKSSRVMEVLLSAVSPMELLTGKIIGQMGVGLLILIVYCGLGIAGLVASAMLSILPLINLVYLLVYFLIAFFLIASMMAAVGSAVSDIKEAQSLLGPIMIVLIIPMMLWMPIMRNPNSMFAQVCSFIPPMSPFIMILRLSGSEQVPTWQIVASIVVGVVSMFVFLWAAAKVFRVGVLMYGKPPDFKTLVRWIRMA
jgi:ABC-2 type transport system permease protein